MTGQRDTDQTVAWLRADRAANRGIWYRLCQARVHDARNLPALFPSAFAAMVGTPQSDRVYDIGKVTRGMQGFADNPNDSNPYGHTFTFVGRSKGGVPLVDTNDALREGYGSVVGYNWFQPHWNVPFSFAATSCNGYSLLLPSDAPKPKPHPAPPPKPPKGEDWVGTADNFSYAEHRLEKALVWFEKNGHPTLARKTKREIADLKKIIKQINDKKGKS